MTDLPKKSISQDRMSRMKHELLDTGADLIAGTIPETGWPGVVERLLDKYFKTREIDIDDMKAGEEVGCGY